MTEAEKTETIKRFDLDPEHWDCCDCGIQFGAQVVWLSPKYITVTIVDESKPS